MFSLFKRSKPVFLSRNDLRILISRECENQTFVPLDKVYRLVPNHRWLLNRTPIFNKYIKNFNDCNHIACLSMAKMQSHCVGMAIISTDDNKIDHCLNIVCLEDRTIQLYDSMKRTLVSAKKYKIKRIWL